MAVNKKKAHIPALTLLSPKLGVGMREKEESRKDCHSAKNKIKTIPLLSGSSRTKLYVRGRTELPSS